MASSDRRYRDVDGNLNIALMNRDFGCSATTGSQGSGFEMGLSAARTALSGALPDNTASGFLRSDANLAVSV
jgi:hypothetical protein